MKERIILPEDIEGFGRYLRGEEREPGTVEKYCRDARAFARWLHGRRVTKELTVGWKEHLHGDGYAPVTINSMLVALNHFLCFLGWSELRGRPCGSSEKCSAARTGN